MNEMVIYREEKRSLEVRLLPVRRRYGSQECCLELSGPLFSH
jgi:hypothetical protein